MYTLYGKQVSGIVAVGGTLGVTQLPLFYTGTYPTPVYKIDTEEQLQQAKVQIDHASVRPNYAVFFGLEDIEQRVRHIESTLGIKFILEKQIEASFLDDVFYRLNPKHNKNQTTDVFKIDMQ